MKKIVSIFMLVTLTVAAFCKEVKYKVINVATPGGLRKAAGYWASIKNLKLTGTIDSIGWWAFYDCSGFTGKLTIPNNVTVIGESAFDYCENISEIRIESTTPIAYQNNMLPADKPVRVPAAAVAAYKAADGWKSHNIISQ